MANTIKNRRESPIQVSKVRATPPHTFLLTKFISKNIQRSSYYKGRHKIQQEGQNPDNQKLR